MFVVIGEVLVDVGADGTARAGGSPYNVAIGLARLGRPACFAGRLSGDPYGRLLREHALESGVDLSSAVDAAEPTTTAHVTLRDGIADYRFDFAGTAAFAWTEAELAALPAAPCVHYGSLASWLPPGDALIEQRIRAYRAAGAMISYDPNARPQLQPDRARAREQVERSVGLAHLVKVSSEDLAHLYPGTPADEAARGWLALGPHLVVVTDGADGATAHTPTQHMHRPAPKVEVVDTVGAGDAFMSGLLDALAERGVIGFSSRMFGSAAENEQVRGKPDPLGTVTPDVLAAVLDHAGLVAALTCARAGADPPRRAELPPRA